MKINILLFSIVALLLATLTSRTYAQASTNQETEEMQQAIKTEKDAADKERIREAINLKNTTKAAAKTTSARAKEANRINDEAIEAAREAKQSARLAGKAQRNRTNADKQARKAARATAKSNNN